jgi:hypothetical protein
VRSFDDVPDQPAKSDRLFDTYPPRLRLRGAQGRPEPRRRTAGAPQRRA